MILFFILFPLVSIAQLEDGGLSKISGCRVTPAVTPVNISLSAVGRSNNLIRKAGSPRKARGTYVRIEGKLVDSDCVPISNALVKIWQADSAGKYKEAYTLFSEWSVVDKDYDPNFLYSGSTHTNNMGEFVFLTILPGAPLEDSTDAPRINIAIKDDQMGELSTSMFFEKHPRNKTDQALLAIDEKDRELLIAKGERFDPQKNFDGMVYKFLITMHGANNYRKY